MLATVLRRSHYQLQAHRSWLAAFTVQTQLLGAYSRERNVRGFAAQYTDGKDGTRHVRHSARKTTRPQKRKNDKTSFIRRLGSDPEPSAFDLVLSEFAEVIESGVIEDVIEVYDSLPASSSNEPLLEREHTWRLAQCIHEAFRKEGRLGNRSSKDENRRDAKDKLVEFAERLVKDIKKDLLLPDHRAHVHLLALFKESGVRDAGVRFWDWLRTQGDRYVNADVYGAAIELLATDGVPLADLEKLYEEALTRFPENFHAYHLSPQAVLIDREQPTMIKGLSMVLLQGILTARALHGDSRNAYLALDTGLRLYPTLTPPRFFVALLEERPASEAYTLAAMAHRAGISLPYESVRRVMTALRAASDMSNPATHGQAVRALLSLSYMLLGAGRVITSNLVSEIVISITQTLRLKGFANISSEEKERVVEDILSIVSKTLELFARYGAAPSISAFNSIITNVAGFGQAKHVVDIALKDADSLGLKPTIVTRRSTLAAAGPLHDSDMLKKSWAELVEARTARKEKTESSDFHILVKAALLCNEAQWASGICQTSISHLAEHVQAGILEHASSQSEMSDSTLPASQGSLDVSQLFTEMDKVQADLRLIDERTLDRPAFQDFSTQHLPMTLNPPGSDLALPEHEARALYDELTSEPGSSVQTTTTNQESHVSSTGLSFGELRYENWKSINYLLRSADKTDREYSQAVDAAISQGMAPPRRDVGFEFGKSVNGSYGLSDVATAKADPGKSEHAEPQTETTDVGQVERLREEVLRLRGWNRGRVT